MTPTRIQSATGLTLFQQLCYSRAYRIQLAITNRCSINYK